MEIQKNFNVLLADDDQDDRELFVEAISDAKTNVQAVDGGAKLIDLLESGPQRPDCVFLDLNMPGKSGVECLREIRANPKLCELPVIIYSTSSNRRDIEQTFSLGANLYVIKSGSYKTLRETLLQILRLDWLQHQPGTSIKNFVFSS